jgi:hypothetical protein
MSLNGELRENYYNIIKLLSRSDKKTTQEEFYNNQSKYLGVNKDKYWDKINYMTLYDLVKYVDLLFDSCELNSEIDIEL